MGDDATLFPSNSNDRKKELIMTSTLKRFCRDESGATAIEYGLIAAGIAVVVIVAVQTLGGTLNKVFTGIDASLTPPTTSTTSP